MYTRWRIEMKKSLLVLALAAVVLMAGTAMADTVTASVVSGKLYQQTTNSPCVLGENSCNNPTGFLYTLGTGGGNITSYDLTSPTYTVSQITTLLNSNGFFVGVDLNNTNDNQTLTLFTIRVNGAVVYTGSNLFTGVAGNNGNGYADLLLSNNGAAFSLVGYGGSSTVTFEGALNPANDGGEQFFLIAGSAVTPEPGSLALLSAGLIGLGGLVRRRKQ
jgi:PEP-CTERM motif